MEPKVTDLLWPMAGTATATTGEKPSPINRGATTAIGTPYPATPCKNELKIQPKISS